MSKMDAVTLALLIVGGANWGLVALAEFDLVATLFAMEFGETNVASRVVYGLVGLSAIWQAVRLPAVARTGQARPHAVHS